ncbi:MAG: radical SAM protein, partial [Candidatus Omnitrophica bacterium]|nr:radical SAM protein [Candidatus Omnitrophota bacterium]
MFKSLMIKKYQYAIFLKSLSLRNKIKVGIRKLKSDILRIRPCSLEVGLTYRCQLSCVHCGIYGQKDESRSELSQGEVFDLIEQAYNSGIYLIIFSGGEPLIRDEMPEYVKYSVDRGMISAVSTNGLLLSSGMISRLKNAG